MIKQDLINNIGAQELTIPTLAIDKKVFLVETSLFTNNWSRLSSNRRPEVAVARPLRQSSLIG